MGMKGHLESLGEHHAEEKAPALYSYYTADLLSGKILVNGSDDIRTQSRVEQNRRDILEQDSGLRKIGYIANCGTDTGYYVHGLGGDASK